MNKFLIPPEDCLILKAFRDSNSLREAAAKLNCDPAGLARRVQQISKNYGLLHKVENRWQVTARGLDFVAWVEDSIQSQTDLVRSKINLRVASTIWLLETQIIPHLPKLQSLLQDETSFQITYPDRGFEHAIISGAVDFVIVCHPPENPEIEHRQLTAEEWVIIAPPSWQKYLTGKKEKYFDLIKDKPFVRHAELNADLFLPGILLKDSGIAIDNLTGIRSAVRSGLGWSLVPKLLVSREIKNKDVIEIPFSVAVRDRKVCVWWLRNRQDMKRKSAKICQWIQDVCV